MKSLAVQLALMRNDPQSRWAGVGCLAVTRLYGPRAAGSAQDSSCLCSADLQAGMRAPRSADLQVGIC
jgi:hypothetical protein